MKKKYKDNLSRYKQIKDYYPLTNPHTVDKVTHVSVPSEEDIEEAKNWVDDVEK